MAVKQIANIKAICDRDALVEAMNLITGVVAGRTPTPALQCVLIAGDDGRLRLSASDTEISLSLTVDRVDLEVDGTSLIPAEKLSQIAKNCDDSTLTIVGDESALKVRSSDSRFTVFGFPISEAFSVPVAENNEADFSISGFGFKKLMDRSTFAAATDHSRYAINGVLLDRTGNNIRLVATNGHRLAIASGQCEGDDKSQNCIIPTKAMNLLKKLIGDEQSVVSVQISSSQITFLVSNVNGTNATLTSNLVEGTFPPFEDVVPKDLNRKATISTEALNRAVRRANLMTNEESRGVRLVFDGESLLITSRAPETGEAEIEVPITSFTGERLEIGFNPAYIMDALKVADADEITIELKKSEKPGLIRCGSDFVYVIMPVSLNS